MKRPGLRYENKTVSPIIAADNNANKKLIIHEQKIDIIRWRIASVEEKLK